MKPEYALPVLMRAGLGNMLMPWGRAIVWALGHNACVLAPRWFKMRVGPYRRREFDKRRYERSFTKTGYVTGVERLIVLARGTFVGEGAEPSRSGFPTVVRFEGLGSFLDPLLGHHETLDRRLRQMTRPELLPPSDDDFVGVHVRMGDYPTAWRLPIEWYVDVVRELRTQLDTSIPVRIFSDGPDDELAPLLRLPDVIRRRDRAAVTDLLELSQAACIVPSASTFSAWAGFLRQAPMLWHPGRTMRSHHDDQMRKCLEWDTRSPLPESMLIEVARRLASDPISAWTDRSAPDAPPTDPN